MTETRQDQKGLVAKVEEPNKDNVNIGDFIVVPYGENRTRIEVVCSIGQESVFYKEKRGLGATDIKEVPYRCAIILKRNEGYLVGRDLQKEIPS